jgi:hypothetical protein
MPCDPAKLAKLNRMMDAFLESRRLHPELDEDEDQDICDPLSAPPELFTDGEHGGIPEKIHGEGDK